MKKQRRNPSADDLWDQAEGFLRCLASAVYGLLYVPDKQLMNLGIFSQTF